MNKFMIGSPEDGMPCAGPPEDDTPCTGPPEDDTPCTGPPGDCTPWTGPLDTRGYPIRWQNNRQVRLTQGWNLCNNRKCTNPDHWSPLTLKQRILVEIQKSDNINVDTNWICSRWGCSRRLAYMVLKKLCNRCKRWERHGGTAQCHVCLRKRKREVYRKWIEACISYKGGVCADCGLGSSGDPPPTGIFSFWAPDEALRIPYMRGGLPLDPAIREVLDGARLLCANCWTIRRFPLNSKVERYQVKRNCITRKNSTCNHCGLVWDPNLHPTALMDFHHRDPNQKLINPSSYAAHPDLIYSELEFCDMLCKNCHRTEENRLAEARWAREQATGKVEFERRRGLGDISADQSKGDAPADQSKGDAPSKTKN